MKALEISPSFIRTFYEVAQAYLNKVDYENAIKYFKKAAELNPSVGLSYWYLGAAYFESGDMENGLKAIDDAIKYGYAFSESDTLRLINMYVKVGDFKQIVFLYEGLVDTKPDNPQYRASLATAYVKIGKIDEAVEQARAAAKINKEFETEARAFVQSLGREF